MKHLTFLFFLFVLFTVKGGDSFKYKNEVKNEIEVGEELTYIVKYSFLELGELKFKVLEKRNEGENTYYRTMVYMDSYSSVPFVDLHEIYESHYNVGHYSDYFKVTHKSDNYLGFADYNFNYHDSIVHIRKGNLKPYKIFFDTTYNVTEKLQDGLSLFYYARAHSGTNRKEIIPCIVSEKLETVEIQFDDKVEPVSSSFIDYEVECVKLEGTTDFEGVYGFTGDFIGWFSNDKYAVPIYAKMSVLIGNITLHLKSWRKSNWKPPRVE